MTSTAANKPGYGIIDHLWVVPLQVTLPCDINTVIGSWWSWYYLRTSMIGERQLSTDFLVTIKGSGEAKILFLELSAITFYIVINLIIS